MNALARCARRWSLVSGCLLGAIAFGGLAARAAKPTEAAGAERVELFAALKAKDITVKFVPTDATKAHLQVTNTSQRTLTVELPKVFAGAPILAQQGLQGLTFGGKLSNSGNAAQILGTTPGGQNGQNGQNGAPPFQNFFMMNIPPGKTQEMPLTCVCLEYGKPTPSSDLPYKAVVLDDVTKKPEVRIVLEELADGKLDQRTAQILAWHFNNKMSFSQLVNAGQGAKRVNEAKSIAERIRQQVAIQATPSPGEIEAKSQP